MADTFTRAPQDMEEDASVGKESTQRRISKPLIDTLTLVTDFKCLPLVLLQLIADYHVHHVVFDFMCATCAKMSHTTVHAGHAMDVLTLMTFDVTTNNWSCTGMVDGLYDEKEGGVVMACRAPKDDNDSNCDNNSSNLLWMRYYHTSAALRMGHVDRSSNTWTMLTPNAVCEVEQYLYSKHDASVERYAMTYRYYTMACQDDVVYILSYGQLIYITLPILPVFRLRGEAVRGEAVYDADEYNFKNQMQGYRIDNINVDESQKIGKWLPHSPKVTKSRAHGHSEDDQYVSMDGVRIKLKTYPLGDSPVAKLLSPACVALASGLFVFGGLGGSGHSWQVVVNPMNLQTGDLVIDHCVPAAAVESLCNRYGHVAVAISDTKCWLMGGLLLVDGTSIYTKTNIVEEYDSIARTFTKLDWTLDRPRANFTARYDSCTGALYVAGDSSEHGTSPDGSSSCDQSFLVKLAISHEWIPLPSIPLVYYSASCVV